MTKQFTFLFILVTVAIFAICLSAALAHREATTTYDLSGIHDGLYTIADQAAWKIGLQEEAVNYWVDEATYEVWEAAYANCYYCDFAWSTVNPAP